MHRQAPAARRPRPGALDCFKRLLGLNKVGFSANNDRIGRRAGNSEESDVYDQHPVPDYAREVVTPIWLRIIR